MNIQPGYETLAGVLQRALDQAQNGKGAERHANALPFDQQPMQTIAAQVGVGFLTGQAIKKAQESYRLPPGRDVAELLGAINYLAGAVLFLEREAQQANPLPTLDEVLGAAAPAQVSEALKHAGDGWIEWHGGECPVDPGFLVDVKFRDGISKSGIPALVNLDSARDAGHAFWRNDGQENDIVAYRVSNHG